MPHSMKTYILALMASIHSADANQPGWSPGLAAAASVVPAGWPYVTQHSMNWGNLTTSVTATAATASEPEPMHTAHASHPTPTTKTQHERWAEISSDNQIQEDLASGCGCPTRCSRKLANHFVKTCRKMNLERLADGMAALRTHCHEKLLGFAVFPSGPDEVSFSRRAPGAARHGTLASYTAAAGAPQRTPPRPPLPSPAAPATTHPSPLRPRLSDRLATIPSHRRAAAPLLWRPSVKICKIPPHTP